MKLNVRVYKIIPCDKTDKSKDVAYLSTVKMECEQAGLVNSDYPKNFDAAYHNVVGKDKLKLKKGDTAQLKLDRPPSFSELHGNWVLPEGGVEIAKHKKQGDLFDA